jgi:glutamyl-tRNA reductase
MSVLTTRHLVANDVNVILVGREVGKTIKIACEISDKVSVAPYSEIGSLINSHRIFFTATSAPHAVITGEMVAEKEFHRYWFDMAVPRDIDIRPNSRISIYTVDDLKNVVQKNMTLREEEASKAYKIVGEYTGNFFSWLDTLSVDPIIKELRTSAQTVAKNELDKAVAKGYIPEAYRKNVSQILHNAFKAFLHHPTVAIKEVADKQEADDVINTVKRLFAIEEERLKLVPKNNSKSTEEERR